MQDTALLLLDLQNDFIAAGGAYHRGGQSAPEIAALPARLAPLVAAARAAGLLVVSTHFTLVPLHGGAPYIAPHLARARPFLRAGDFSSGSWGHALASPLTSDVAVEKIAFSAFYQTRLEWVLARTGIRRLLVAGIVTNGGVASTVRDAHVRDLDVTLLEDGCAAFDPAVHATALAALRPVALLTTIAAALDLLARAVRP